MCRYKMEEMEDMEMKIPFPTLAELREGYPEGDPVNLYLDEVGHLETLSREQEQNLAREMLEGSEEAREKLVEHNLLRVVAIAREYRGRGLCILDLMMEGNNGLIWAAEHYRDMAQSPFAEFAVQCIHKSIRKALRETVTDYRIPDHIQEIIKAVRREKSGAAPENQG